jgi:hypothetical protein
MIIKVDVSPVCYGSHPCIHDIKIHHHDKKVVVQDEVRGDDILEQYYNFIDIKWMKHLNEYSPLKHKRPTLSWFQLAQREIQNVIGAYNAIFRI